jgi:hypothetical protein
MSLRNTLGGMVRRQASATRRSRPQLEALESRTLLTTYVVNNPFDNNNNGSGFTGTTGDLRYALTNATDGDTITFDASVVGPGKTIDLTAALPDITHNITIQGPGANQLTVQRASGGNYSIFRVTAANSFFFFNPNVTISGLTISKGAATNGGGIYNSGNLVLSNVVIIGNTATNGGGIYNTTNPNSFFNTTSLTLNNCVIQDNRATNGGGLYNDANANNNFFFNTTAAALSNCTVSGNTAVNGAGIYNNGSSNNLFFNTTAMTIDASSIVNNRATSDNQSGGGGIWNNGTMVITNSAIAGNTATALAAIGGGIVNGINGSLNLNNSTVAQNSAVASSAFGWVFGGGIYNEGKLSLLSDTIASNLAQSGAFAFGMGGGVFNEIGIFDTGIGTITTGNTIFANNVTTAFGNDLFGTVTSNGNNLIRDSFGADGFGASDVINRDPLLGPLQNNGGPTLTMALLPGSPAIDRGNNANAPQYDQRGQGFARIVNGTIDIGAYEFGAGATIRSIVVPPSGSQSAPILNQGSATETGTEDSSSGGSRPLPMDPITQATDTPPATASTPLALLQSAQNVLFSALDDALVNLIW